LETMQKTSSARLGSVVVIGIPSGVTKGHRPDSYSSQALCFHKNQ